MPARDDDSPDGRADADAETEADEANADVGATGSGGTTASCSAASPCARRAQSRSRRRTASGTVSAASGVGDDVGSAARWNQGRRSSRIARCRAWRGSASGKRAIARSERSVGKTARVTERGSASSPPRVASSCRAGEEREDRDDHRAHPDQRRPTHGGNNQNCPRSTRNGPRGGGRARARRAGSRRRRVRSSRRTASNGATRAREHPPRAAVHNSEHTGTRKSPFSGDSSSRRGPPLVRARARDPRARRGSLRASTGRSGTHRLDLGERETAFPRTQSLEEPRDDATTVEGHEGARSRHPDGGTRASPRTPFRRHFAGRG